MAEQEGYGGNYGGDGTKPGRHVDVDVKVDVDVGVGVDVDGDVDIG